MAYNQKFNPDALPMHAEPNEAAQILARAQGQQTHSQQPTPQPQQQPSKPPSTSPRITPQSSYQNRPPPPLPPLPSQQQQQPSQSDPYYRPHSTSNASFHRPHSTSNAHINQSIRSPVQAYAGFQSPPPQNNYSTPPVPGSFPNSNPHGGQQHDDRRPSATRSSSHSPRPATGGSADPSLWPLFRAVDTNGTGKLGEQELSKALMNDEFTSFDPVTVRLMIRMFDTHHTGSIEFEEFCGLWGFLAAWRALFRRFDEDRSGSISYDEFSKALVAFGYNLSPNFVGMMYRIYDKRGDQSMSFDMFVQSCISLKRMTDVFKKYDADRDGYITLSFEEFLTEIMNQR